MVRLLTAYKSYQSLDSVERHIFTEEPDRHRDFVLRGIDQATTTEISKITAEYRKEIQTYARNKVKQEVANQMKAAKAAEKRERDTLPFVK